MEYQQMEFDFYKKTASPANVEKPGAPSDGVARFIVGRTYRDEWSYDGEDYFLEYTIVSRTRCTITATDKDGETMTFHLCRNPEKWGSEFFMPWGNYSMAPCVDARRNLVEE